MDYDKLFKLGKPSFYTITMDEPSFADLYLQLTERSRGAVIKTIRGKKSRTVSDFFNEIAAAMQFPYYFGENWAALDDCIADLDWIEGDAYLLMVSQANLLLDDVNSESFRVLIQILSSANEKWLTPNQYIPRNRQPTPFHVLFQCSESDISAFSQRLAHSGGEFEIL